MLVFVYKNLHKNLWSIKAMGGPHKGKVIGYAKEVVVSNATPKVSEKGRQRVLREKKKNVHAGIEGELAAVLHYEERLPTPSFEFMRLTGNQPIVVSYDSELIAYNPYVNKSFVLANDTTQELARAGVVTFRHDGTVYALNPVTKPQGRQLDLFEEV